MANNGKRTSRALTGGASSAAGPEGSDGNASGTRPWPWEVLGRSRPGAAEVQQDEAETGPAAAATVHGPTCACCRPGGGGGPRRHVITYVDAVVLEVESADGEIVYFDGEGDQEQDTGGGAAAEVAGRGAWAAGGPPGGVECGLVVEAEVVSVPTGAEAAQYLVFEGEEDEEDEELEEGGQDLEAVERRGPAKAAGAAGAGGFMPPMPAATGAPFVYVPDVELRRQSDAERAGGPNN
ncbi:hypothetical protein HYH02_011226 [Chlamydomonas schloesseri]|uniref:Uncharacterized protein n=1 Tax=Chlamydomonas schloesseri TaxID=2026947 RepID=A0A835TG09_9CHLO|nr:hypothetical protein HYH02_011226 [Chlamydomonas schloesseri]|eukprot:KAG2437586.1 hypothetical protein HYH02_011226 [Chlamydomonas schloesseri]